MSDIKFNTRARIAYRLTMKWRNLNNFNCTEEGEGERGEDEEDGEEGDQVTEQTGPVHGVSLIITIYDNILGTIW